MSGSAVVQECSSDPWGNVEHVIQAAAGITFPWSSPNPEKKVSMAIRLRESFVDVFW